MRILLLDIETSPNLAYVWGLFKQNVSLSQIAESGQILCWAAKWLGEDKMMFGSIQRSSERVMLQKIHSLLEQADAVVHYNGQRFDMPTLNREWLKYGFRPPAPYKQIDLLLTCRKQFRFLSNKLDYVSRYLDIGKKDTHAGFELWLGCMRGDKSAWKTMGEYNRQDVVLLEDLYKRLLPWIPNHPSHGALSGFNCCPKCGSENFQQRGYAMTMVHKYRRYRCKGCGGWFRGNKTTLHKLTAGEERFVNVGA